MRSPWTGTIVEIYFDTHPHWVMDYGCYAMTLRCRGSLPLAIQEKLKEIGLSLKGIAPASPDAVALRRKHFAVLDHALDAATGSCPFAERKAAQAMSDLLADYDFDGLCFDHWVVMPNHLHLITAPLELTCAQAFRTHIGVASKHSAQSISISFSRPKAVSGKLHGMIVGSVTRPSTKAGSNTFSKTRSKQVCTIGTTKSSRGILSPDHSRVSSAACTACRRVEPVRLRKRRIVSTVPDSHTKSRRGILSPDPARVSSAAFTACRRVEPVRLRKRRIVSTVPDSHTKSRRGILSPDLA